MSPAHVRLKHISRFRDRHGHLRHYLRVPGHKPVSLPGEPGSTEFMAAYWRAMAELQPAAPAPKVTPGSLDAVALAYYDSAAFTGLRASSQAVYRRIVEELRAKHGDKPFRMLDAEGVRRLLAEKAPHRAAQNHRLRVLRALSRQAVTDRLIRTDPTAGIERQRVETKGFQAWSEDHIAQYEARWPAGTIQRRALYLMLYTGQRRSDVVRMGRQMVRGDSIEFRQVKTGKALSLPILPSLAAELVHVPADDLLFLRTQRGAGFTPNGFYMRFAEWCRDAGLPAGLSPHGLRKAMGRRLAEDGASAHQIMAVLGVTLAVAEIYTRSADQARLARAGLAQVRKGNAASNPPSNPVTKTLKS